MYTNGATFPMLVQVVYVAYTPLCKWYVIYRVVGRPIADISDLRLHLYQNTKCRCKYVAEVGYRGYGPTHHTI